MTREAQSYIATAATENRRPAKELQFVPQDAASRTLQIRGPLTELQLNRLNMFHDICCQRRATVMISNKKLQET